MIIDDWLAEEVEPRTDNTELNTLLVAWINEKTSPELLQFQELFLLVLRKLESQAEILNDMSQERSILELEISRLQYIIKSYFRKRLEKIERYAFYYEFNESFKLSMQEHVYLKEYLVITREYILESGLETFPKALHAFDDFVGDLNMISSPNLNQAVVCKVLDNIGEVMINDSESVYMEKNNIYILKYKTVQSLLEKGLVQLL
jgi:GINS complex subunit 4